MPTPNILDQLSIVTPVRYKRGLFADGSPKYTNAPFALIQLPANPENTTRSEMYLMPTPIYTEASAADGLLNSDTITDAQVLGRGEMGYMRDPMTIEEHEMGNWQGRGEDWRGLHRFGLI